MHKHLHPARTKINPRFAIQIHRLHSPEDPAFPDLLRIYTQSLPASERKSPAALATMLARPEYIFLTASTNNITQAFAIAINFTQCPDATLLEYLAADPAYRNHGLGHHLFQALVQRPELNHHFVIAEVEALDDLASSQRKSFYRKIGFREIANLTYLMPQVSDTPPPPMHLLLYKPDLPTSITKPQLQSWLECIYAEVYAQPIPNPRVEEMLGPLPCFIHLTP